MKKAQLESVSKNLKQKSHRKTDLLSCKNIEQPARSVDEMSHIKNNDNHVLSQLDPETSSRPNNTSKRGFASMPKERVQQIAQMGGKARKQELGHQGYVELGRKGGMAHGSAHTHATANIKSRS